MMPMAAILPKNQVDVHRHLPPYLSSEAEDGRRQSGSKSQLVAQFQLRAGVFLRLLQKQREPLLIKCQLLALLLCSVRLRPEKHSMKQSRSGRVQTKKRTKAPETFACDKPLLFQSGGKAG